MIRNNFKEIKGNALKLSEIKITMSGSLMAAKTVNGKYKENWFELRRNFLV